MEIRQGTRYPLKGQGFCASPMLREMLRLVLREMLPHLLRQRCASCCVDCFALMPTVR